MKRMPELVIRVPDRKDRYVAVDQATFKTVGHGRTLAAALKCAETRGHHCFQPRCRTQRLGLWRVHLG